MSDKYGPEELENMNDASFSRKNPLSQNTSTGYFKRPRFMGDFSENVDPLDNAQMATDQDRQLVHTGVAAASNDPRYDNDDSQFSQLSCNSDFSIREPDIATFSSILGSGKEIIRETITTLFNKIASRGEDIISQTKARREIRNQQEIEVKKLEIEARIEKHNNKLSQLKKTVETERTTRIKKVAELETVLHLLITEEHDILNNKELLRTGLPEIFTNKDFKWWTETIDAKDTETWLMNYIRQTDILLAIQQTGIIDNIRCRKNVLPEIPANITLADLIEQTIREGALIYSDGLSLDPDGASHKITPDGLIIVLNNINNNTEIDYQSIWTSNAKSNTEVDQLFAAIPVSGVDMYPNLTAAFAAPATIANVRGTTAATARGIPPLAVAAVAGNEDVVEIYDDQSDSFNLQSEPSFQASGRWTIREDAWQMKYEGKQLIVPDGTSLEEVESILKAAEANIKNIRETRQDIVATQEYRNLMASLYTLSDNYVLMINNLYTEIGHVKNDFINGNKNIDMPLHQIEWTTIINGILLKYSTEYDEIFQGRLRLISQIKNLLSPPMKTTSPSSGGNKSRKHKKHLNKKPTRKHKKRYTRKLHKKHKRGHTKKQ